MKLRWRISLITLALTLFLGIACVYQADFITYFVEPIARVLWLVYRTFLSVDQEFYWGLLILTALVLVLRLIPNKPDISYRQAYLSSIQENNRVKYWEELLMSAEKSDSDRLILQHELEVLEQSIGELVERNGEKGFLIPPVSRGIQQRILNFWKFSPLHRMINRKQVHRVSDLEKSVDITLKSFETKLEIDHYGPSNRTKPG